MPREEELSRREFVAGVAATAILAAVPGDVLAEENSEGSWDVCKWMNEPRKWKAKGNALICTADPKTDFWQKTFYEYSFDTGHFFHRPMKGDFSTSLKIDGKYREQYDQAGLMIRVDQSNWMKCGIEFVDGHHNLSVVVTRDYSDWSTARLPDGTGALWMRVVRKGPALDIFYSLDGKKFDEIRVAYLGKADVVELGPMCAAPMGKGFDVEFTNWDIKKS